VKPSGSGRSAAAVFGVFLRLGLTSFGGPVAHLGYFRQEFVVRRRWLDERAYADLVALCQFLPGPASSQVGFAIGLLRAGRSGALAAWAGFTLPSALALIALALGLAQAGSALPAGLLQGLKIAAVAVVAQAAWGMGRALCQGATRLTLMAAAAAAVLLLPGTATQLGVIAAAGVFGAWWLHAGAAGAAAAGAAAGAGVEDLLAPPLSRREGLLWLGLFALLLAVLPLAAAALAHPALAQADAFYRAGALVFGGGHVVLPLLQAEVVPTGWVREDLFLAGYGAAQAVPGPLFTFAAFLGASAGSTGLGGWAGGLLCLGAVFLPGLLLVAGALPFWAALRRRARAQAALAGVNAAVVGLLLAALYDPVWTAAIHGPRDAALALAALVALHAWKLPPWAVVLGCGGIGVALGG
jgi:chromate transporter